MPKAKTKEEVREEFLRTVKSIAKYWATVEIREPERNTVEERCDGVAFSILNIFDGCNGNLPAFDIVLAPHPDDKKYYITQNENWYKKGMVINDDVTLHHEYCNLDKEEI